ncbi:damage-control phosphatase ARMT1 family protein [Streptomyces sp. NBC_01016]|uniref:damage-control phosphatase ARMT1 family protein n=1 Tax=Streptomyces sp. NBC_01016 TaxID=2903720 RepID=UPI00225AC90E|nr:damage-control phosphatase ARMT1 family protein [Streptomyces sp. NBC_01016]MCX4835828.1 damage-control phosphatase ARMT1 family protein [Streptomyces sp. NBC_01016]
MSDTSTAPVIHGNVPGSFARGVLVERHPALIEKVRAAFPYGPEQHRALDALLRNTADGVIESLGDGAPDRERWDAWGSEWFGESWFDAPFLWAESYFYRQLLDAVGYFTQGPWRGVDPFRPFKQAELDTPETDAELGAVDRLASVSVAERERGLLLGALWGNRADLGFRVTADGDEPGADTQLVADDSDAFWAALPQGGGATVSLVADNAGRELLADLLLVDHLLHSGRAARVIVQVKPYPYYVSDAMTADVVDCVRRLTRAGGAAAEAGGRIWEAMGDGRLEVRAHPFSCAPLPYADMPDDLRAEFAATTLTVLKGDLNYRRLVGDRLWEPTASFAERVAYWPTPVVALRTLKCDVIVGLEASVRGALDAAEPHQKWRVSGAHALVQARM